MKATLCVAAMTVVIGSAMAQQNPAGTTPQSSSQSTPDIQAGKDKSKETMSAASGAVNELKTKTFKGTLMDASCAGVQAGSATTSASTGSPASLPNPGTPANPATPATPGSEMQSAANKQAAAGTANRSSDSASGSCNVSSSTSQFAMKLEDGKTLAFDLVGNDRAKEQIQKNKKWTEAASSGKEIKAKVSGVVSGEKLVVSSIH